VPGIGPRLRRARLEAGLTQQQLAGDRYTKAYVSALENGLARPSMVALEYLSARLGRRPAALLDDPTPGWTRLEADVKLAAGDWSTAADAYRSLLETATGPSQRAELLLGLAEALCRLDQGLDAIAAASEAAEVLARLGRDADAASANYWLAYALYERDMINESRALLGSILAAIHAGLAVQSDFRMRALTALAAVENRDGEHDTALAYLQEAKGIAGQLDDRRRAAFLFSEAVTRREAGDSDGAIRLGTQSLALYRAAEAALEAASIENDLALAFLAAHDIEKATEMAAAARAAFEAHGAARWLAHVAETQAQIALASGDLGAASRYVDEALRLAHETGNRKATISALLTGARVRREHGDTAGAIEGYERAAAEARASSSRGQLRAALREWAELLAVLGRHEQAYALLREALPG
jgi:transcriptional regulator with XRE-family HTH domain